MKKDKIIQTLKNKCKKHLKEHESSSDKQAYEIIMKILSTPDAFSDISAETSLNILYEVLIK